MIAFETQSAVQGEVPANLRPGHISKERQDLGGESGREDEAIRARPAVQVGLPEFAG